LVRRYEDFDSLNLVLSLDGENADFSFLSDDHIRILSHDETFFLQFFAKAIKCGLRPDLKPFDFDVSLERAGVFVLCLIVIVGKRE
jgi:hypothetical protein